MTSGNAENPGNAEDDETADWLRKLEGADFSEGSERSVLDRPLAEADLSEIYRLLHAGDDPATRRKAANALGSLANSRREYDAARTADELTRAVLSDDAREVRADAIDALYRHGDERIDRLAETVTRAIERDGGVDAREFFRQWLGADRPAFRLVAAAAMGTLGDESVAPRLREAFTDPDRRVRVRAIRAYGRLGEAADVEPIREALGAGDPAVRRAAAAALADVGTEAALEALLPVAGAEDDRLSRIAVEQLHRLDRRRSAMALIGSLQHRSEAVRREALVSLIRLYTAGESVRPGEVRDYLLDGAEPSELVDLAELLADVVDGGAGVADRVDREVELQAVWLLGETADLVARGDVRRRLVDVFGNRDGAVADLAAAYLRRLEGETLEAELRALIRGADVPAETRERAASILETIKRNTAADVEDRSVEYTYVQDPTDYTEKHGG